MRSRSRWGRSSFGLRPTHELTDASEHLRGVWEELFLVCKRGGVGDLDAAMRMPIQMRQWWVERTLRHEAELAGQRPGMPGQGPR